MERCKGSKDVRHVGCGGAIAVDGNGWVKLPTGFGFRKGVFVVDAVRVTTFHGFCMKCNKSGHFARTDVKAKAATKVIKKLNGRALKVGC